MSEKETTFEQAKVGDRVYSPLFKCKNIGDKTNGIISWINGTTLTYIPDVQNIYEPFLYFNINGTVQNGGGQVLFWENPIKEIPIRLKRKVTKKGWIGIRPLDNPRDGVLAQTTDVYEEREGTSLSYKDDAYQIKPISFDVEE